MIPEVDLETFAAAHGEGAYVLDVREPYEYHAGHVPGAVLMPMGIVPVRAHELPQADPIYVICQSGSRSYQAAMWLNRAGFRATSVRGGTGAWAAAGLPTVTGARAA